MNKARTHRMRLHQNEHYLQIFPHQPTEWLIFAIDFDNYTALLQSGNWNSQIFPRARVILSFSITDLHDLEFRGQINIVTVQHAAAADSWAGRDAAGFFIRARVYIVQERGHLIYYLIEGVFYDIESKQTKERPYNCVYFRKFLEGVIPPEDRY